MSISAWRQVCSGKTKKKGGLESMKKILLTFFVILISGILSLFNFNSTYNVLDSSKLDGVSICAADEGEDNTDHIASIIALFN